MYKYFVNILFFVIFFFNATLMLSAKEFVIIENLAQINDTITRELLNLFGVKTKKKQKETQQEEQQASSLPPTKKMGSNKSSENNITFNDIVGMKNVVNEVKEVVEFLKNPEQFKALGAHIPRGILLEGPPGTGKTLIAKAIANEAGCNFLYESGSSFVEMFVGVGAGRVRELFTKARKSKPTIIFIDEFDAIGAVSRGMGGNEEYRQTMNELLCQLDGFNSDDSIIVIAATNFAKALDPALTRAGRFDRILKVTLPDHKSRKEILTHYKNKLPSAQLSEECLDSIAQKTDGLNCADLRNLVNEAALAAVREKQSVITDKHFVAGIDKVLNQRRR